jgi:signal transduction histidine kinase
MCGTTSLRWIRKGLEDEEATTRRASPALENHSEPDSHTETFLVLTITSTLQGRFMYWKGFEPSELLDYESRLVAFTQELPFQEGRPLSPIVEEGKSSIELLKYSLKANYSPDRQVCMASLRNTEEDELGTQYDNEQLMDVSADEPTINAPQDEDEEHRRIRRAKNAKHAQHRRNRQNRTRELKDLNNAFAVVADHEYRTPIGAIAEAALLAQQLPPNPQIQRLQYLTQCARATRWATSSIFHSESSLEV